MLWVNVFLLLIAVLIFLIILMCFLPVHLIVKYNEVFEVKIKVLSMEFNLNERDKKLRNYKSLSENKLSNGNELKRMIKKIKKFGIVRCLNFTLSFFKVSGKLFYTILEKTNINDIVFILEIGGRDSYSTAISYGQASGIVTMIYDYINSIKHLKSYKISVRPDFLSDKNSLKLKLDISSRIFYMIIGVMMYVKEFSKLMKLKCVGDKDE